MVFVHNLKLTNIGFKTNISITIKLLRSLISLTRIGIGGFQKLLYARQAVVDDVDFLSEMVLFCIKQDKGLFKASRSIIKS